MTAPTVFPQVVLSDQTGAPYDATTPLPVTGTFSASTSATATAAAPSYTEGASGALSQTLTGDLRVSAKQSGAWTVTGSGGTFPVTGTFWQATQPVSGTFWQATQPVSLASVPSHPVTNAGTFAVQAAQSGTWTVGLSASQTLATVTTVGAVTSITNALPAGSNLLGRSVADASSATGGIASTSRIVSAAASTNATSAKASAGRLYAIQGYNASTSVRYLKIYNKASAPTVGTDTPVKTLAIPPGAGFAFDWPLGYSFATGIAYALTTGSADNDTGALTAADVLGLNLDYV